MPWVPKQNCCKIVRSEQLQTVNCYFKFHTLTTSISKELDLSDCNLSWISFLRNKKHSKLITFLYHFLPKIFSKIWIQFPALPNLQFHTISAPKFCVKSHKIPLLISFYISKPFLPTHAFISQRANSLLITPKSCRAGKVDKLTIKARVCSPHQYSNSTFRSVNMRPNFSNYRYRLCYPRYACATT